MVNGLLATLLIGVVGGGIAELIRIGEALRAGKPPKGLEYVGSLIYAVLGGGVVLYGFDTPRLAVEIATLGAAFPALFAGAVRVAKAPGGDYIGGGPRPRDFFDYMASRF